MITIVCRRVENSEELAHCLEIRRAVFVEEQHLFDRSDRDEHDGTCMHLAAFVQDSIIGTVRVYQDEQGDWWGGRLAVLKKYRGRAGRNLVHAAVALVRQCGATHFYANIQKENLNFFKAIGWSQIGSEFMHLGKAHIRIEAQL